MKKALFLFLLLPTLLFPQQWEWINPYPSGDPIGGNYIYNDSIAYLIPFNKSIIKTVLFSDEWEIIETPIFIHDIHYVGEDTAWALGTDKIYDGGIGSLYYTEDGGSNWEVHFEDSILFPSNLFFLNKKKGWVYSRQSYLVDSVIYNDPTFETNDGGKTWEIMKIENENAGRFHSYRFLDSLNGYRFGNMMHITTDGGETWVLNDKVTLESIRDYFVVDSLLHFVGTSIGLFKSRDGGYTWDQLSNWGVDQIIRRKNTFYFFPGTFPLKSTDYGESIVECRDIPIRECTLVKDTIMVGTHAKPELYTHMDSVSGWQRHYFRSILNYIYHEDAAFDFINDDIGWQTYISEKEPNIRYTTITKTTDGGLSWTDQISYENVEHDIEIYDLHFLSDQIGWACGREKLLKTVNGGENWQSILLPVDDTWKSFTFLNDTVFCMMGEKELLITKNNSRDWERVSYPENFEPKYVTFNNSNDIWFIYHENYTQRLFHTTDKGSNWIEHEMPNTSSVHGLISSGDLGWLITKGGVYKTSDGAITWTKEIEASIDEIGYFHPESNKELIVLIANDVRECNIHYTTNFGETWQTYYLNTSVSFLKYDQIDENTAYMFGGCDLIRINNVITSIQQNVENENNISESMMKIFPNPTNSLTTIKVSISTPSKTDIDIYNIQGELVKSIESNYLTTGEHYYHWNGINDHGSTVPSGIYFIRCETNIAVQTQKLIMLK